MEGAAGLKLLPRGAPRVDAKADAKGQANELNAGEYRTVLAEQRTFLAFVRTALAVTAVYRNSWVGGVVGGIVLLIGVLQFTLGADLFLRSSMRTAKGVDVGRLLERARHDSVLVGVAIALIGAASVAYKAADDSEAGDGTSLLDFD